MPSPQRDARTRPTMRLRSNTARMTDSAPRDETKPTPTPAISNPTLELVLASPYCRGLVPGTSSISFIRSREQLVQMKKQLGLDEPNSAERHEPGEKPK